ncbi:MAG TPA: acyl-CoA dehydrogenase family protein [Dehalococcoidia bacterium]|nr:acyl-CoA dehydrogenase family protein [Dehalococcoidia bacterium]
MTIASENDLLAAARGLAPLIAQYHDEIERERRLPLPIVAALQDAGVFRMTMPRSLGGLEAEPRLQFEVLEALSQLDASVGWCGYIGGGAGWFSAYLDEATARQMYPHPDVIGGGAVRPAGRARVVPGGYRVSGRWPFGSGAHHCDWLVGGCFVFDGEERRLDDAGRPDVCMVLMPAADCEIIDTWVTTGLRGSGSVDYAANDRYVPAERSFSLATSPIQQNGPLYRLRTMFLLNHAAVALGSGRAAIDALLALATDKRRVTGTPLREEAYAQAAVARAEALVGAARSYVLTVLDEIWHTLLTGEEASEQQRARFRLAIVNSHTAAVEAVDLMYHTGGGSALYATSPLDRLFRDIHTINQHVIVAPKTYEQSGRVLLGLDPGVPFF